MRYVVGCGGSQLKRAAAEGYQTPGSNASFADQPTAVDEGVTIIRTLKVVEKTAYEQLGKNTSRVATFLEQCRQICHGKQVTSKDPVLAGLGNVVLQYVEKELGGQAAMRGFFDLAALGRWRDLDQAPMLYH